jgi:uncharacterized DUF497 family protein
MFAGHHFEWDPKKNQSNFSKHGIRFEEACLIFDGPVLTRTDDRFAYHEVRKISMGSIEGLIVVIVIHTERNGKTRLISAQLASQKERRIYHEHFEKTS